uniref:Uncharacterized protein n=1 Tax=Arundo donax TaxID=35708 RepID=A0A0A9C2Y9_ARUDO
MRSTARSGISKATVQLSAATYHRKFANFDLVAILQRI